MTRCLRRNGQSAKFFKNVLQTTAPGASLLLAQGGWGRTAASLGDFQGFALFSASGWTWPALCFGFWNSEPLGLQGQGTPSPDLGSLWCDFLHLRQHLPFLYKSSENSSLLMAYLSLSLR